MKNALWHADFCFTASSARFSQARVHFRHVGGLGNGSTQFIGNNRRIFVLKRRKTSSFNSRGVLSDTFRDFLAVIAEFFRKTHAAKEFFRRLRAINRVFAADNNFGHADSVDAKPDNSFFGGKIFANIYSVRVLLFLQLRNDFDKAFERKTTAESKFAADETPN